MTTKYLIRLDDACPTMDSVKWKKMLSILDRYEVKPMVGIIPHNEDPKQHIDDEDPNFWQKAKDWDEKGWAIALHGYNHCYISKEGGINPFWNRSEFAGVSFEIQCKKIKGGLQILNEHGINPKYFFAPSHTFDENTLLALKKCSDIRIISDTIATKPYKSGDFVFIPQLGGHCTEMKIPGIWTFCLHPSMMNENDFKVTEAFFKNHSTEFIGFDDLNLDNIGKKSLFSKLLSRSYFTYRKIRGIK